MRIRCHALAALFVLVLPGTIAGQWIGVRRTPGSLEVVSAGGLNNTADGQGGTQVVSLRFDQRLHLGLMGWVLSPRFLTFNGSVAPSFGQYTTRLEDGMGKGQSLAYTAGVTLFRRRRVTFGAQIGNSSGFSAASLGSRSEWVGSRTSLSGTFRDRYFPVQVQYMNSDGTTIRRGALPGDALEMGQSRRRFTVEVVNPRLTLRYQHERDHNRGFTSEPVRFATTIMAAHRLRWGRGSSLNSAYQLQDRIGSGKIRNNSWSQRLALTHTDQLKSRWGYYLRSMQGGGTGLDGRRASGAFEFSPGPWLSADVDANYQSISTTSGTSNAGYRIAPSVRLRGDLPWGGRGTLSVETGYDQFTRRTVAQNTFVDVLEEEYSVSPALTFRLASLRVDLASIRIWTEDLLFQLAEGIDYLLLEIGDQVEVRILPTGRVQAGESVRVNYRYLALEGDRRAGGFVNTNVGVSYGAVRVGAGHFERSGSLDEGASLGDAGFRESFLSFDLLPRSTPVGELGLSAQVDRRTGVGRNATHQQVSVQLALPRSLPADVTVETALSRTKDNQASAVDALSASLRAGVNAGRSARATASINYLSWNRTGLRERYVAGVLGLNWRWRQVTVDSRVEQTLRWTQYQVSGTRWTLSVGRRF